ncbi:MAG: SIS domain-containing protein [Chloroflexota bacterium]
MTEPNEPIIPREIRDGPAAIRATVAEATPDARRIAAELLARGTRRVHVIGNGTSYHSSLAATAVYRRVAGPDDPIVIASTAAEFCRYGPRLGPGDAVVGISASGEFRDVVAVASELRDVVPVVGIVHVPESSLAAVATHVIRSAGGASHVPVMTKTFSATLAATELLLAGLLGDAQLDSRARALDAAADAADAAIDAALPIVGDLATELATAEHWFVLGGGLAHIASLEAALKLKEIALVHAEGTETWEMESGAATIVNADTVVVGIAPDGRARAATGAVLGHAASWGARVIEVGPEQLVPGSRLLSLTADADEDDAPLVAVPSLALLAFELATRRGLDPDRPGWVERYHSQGLTHIVGV